MTTAPSYITTAQAAKKSKVCTQRILALIAQHRIEGAKKHGPVWLIPSDFKVLPSQKRARRMDKIGRR